MNQFRISKVQLVNFYDYFYLGKTPTGEVYLTTDSPPSQTASIGFFETSAPSKNIEDEVFVNPV